MKDIRQGNDIKVSWSIFKKGGQIFSLEGKKISLYLKSVFGRKELNDFVITGNIIQWTFYGKDQKSTGKYSLELVVNEGEKGMITTDTCDFVNLVSCSCKLQGGEDAPNVETESIELTSTLEYVAGGGDYDDTALWKELENKVDKVEGKGLSTNDFTDEDKEKLAGLENYDDAKLKEELSEIYQPKENIYYLDWDSASGSGELDEATYQAIMAADKVCLKDGKTITEPTIKVKNDADCAYGYVTDKRYVLFVSESNYAIIPTPYYDDKEIKDNITELSAEVGKKQDTISDLENIRSGAEKGATAIQSVKTINGQSIVGSGNIEIQGGGGGASSDKQGVVSQTLNYNTADNTYSVSNVVRGSIPSFFIDLVTEAGASFNAESGYFSLNGIDNIAYDEMRQIYDCRTGYGVNSLLAVYSNTYTARTNFVAFRGYGNSFGNHEPTTIYTKYLCFRNASITKFALCSELALYVRAGSGNNFESLSSGAGVVYISRLEEIIGVLDVENLTGSNNFFYNGAYHAWLTSFKLKSLKASINLSGMPRLSEATILYMINNEKATSAITIKLHADAKAMADASEAIQSALANHANITLGV